MHWLVILGSILGSSTMAGVVTYLLNAWDSRRSFSQRQLERVYTSYINAMAALGSVTSSMRCSAIAERSYEQAHQEAIIALKTAFDAVKEAEMIASLYLPSLHEPVTELQKARSDCLITIAEYRRAIEATEQHESEDFAEQFLKLSLKMSANEISFKTKARRLARKLNRDKRPHPSGWLNDG